MFVLARREGRNEPWALWEGRTAQADGSLCLGQLEVVLKSELEAAQACRRASAQVGLCCSVTAFCKVLLVFFFFNSVNC